MGASLLALAKSIYYHIVSYYTIGAALLRKNGLMLDYNRTLIITETLKCRCYRYKPFPKILLCNKRGLENCNINLTVCLHEDTSSWRLLSVGRCRLQIIKYFSRRH